MARPSGLASLEIAGRSPPDADLDAAWRTAVSTLQGAGRTTWRTPTRCRRLVGGWAVWQDATDIPAVALLRFARRGMDRLLGCGLEHSDGFTHKRLGTIGCSGH